MNDTDASNVHLPSAHDAAIMLTSGIGQIQFARNYTLELLENIPFDLWYKIPDGLPTNVAWQVGHLTVSQYGLLMFRMRGREPEDLQLINGKFRKAYGRESTPSSDSSIQPSPRELLERLATVHQKSIKVLENVDPASLLEPVEMPYAAFPVKLGSVLFCPIHEGIHAGQLGVLRRSLGLASIR